MATAGQIKRLQRALNAFTSKRLAYIAPLLVDGKMGPATKKRIKHVKYWLGYPTAERNALFGRQLFWRMAHPKTRHPEWASARRVALGIRLRVKQRREARKDHRALAAQHGRGFASYGGKTVAAWMVPWLVKSVAHGWKGWVVSGVRTPDYSEHLCIEMCGAKKCPGRCAGRDSNHNMLPSQGEPHGALDVTDYENFARIQREIGSPLRNALPNDRVHFSATGR